MVSKSEPNGLAFNEPNLPCLCLFFHPSNTRSPRRLLLYILKAFFFCLRVLARIFSVRVLQPLLLYSPLLKFSNKQQYSLLHSLQTLLHVVECSPSRTIGFDWPMYHECLNLCENLFQCLVSVFFRSALQTDFRAINSHTCYWNLDIE